MDGVLITVFVVFDIVVFCLLFNIPELRSARVWRWLFFVNLTTVLVWAIVRFFRLKEGRMRAR